MPQLTVPEFARKYSFDQDTVRRFVANGLLRATREDGIFYVEEPSPEVPVGHTPADAVPRLTGIMVAEILGVSSARVRQLYGEGRLRCHFTLGGQRRYSVEDVFRYISSKRGDRPMRARDRIVDWARDRLRAKIAAGWVGAEKDEFDRLMDQIDVMAPRQKAMALARLVIREDRNEKDRLRRAEKVVQIMGRSA